jgi:ubiquinone/menaquinone biosynthesis C-methylase UbiE
MNEFSGVKARQQQTWASGDYSMIAAPMAIMGELLCEAVGLCAGQKVLDVAAGSGNAALAAARRWCEVTAVDYVPALLERGRERARAERLEVHFQEGDAEDLPFPDESFDVVLSAIGVMFAPDQHRAAGELLRVCRPGGKIGLTNWTPDGFVGQWFPALSRYLPPPPNLRPPTIWGTEAGLQELFGEQVASLQVQRRHFYFRYLSKQHWLEYFRAYFGPTKQAFERLDPTSQEHLAQDLLALVDRFNQACDQSMLAPGEYLEVVAIKC